MSTADTTATSALILGHTTSFISEVLSQSELRHQIISIFRQKVSEQILLKPLNLACETLENAISTQNPSIRSSSLRLAEKLLLSYPETPFSSFLLSFIHALCHRPIDASLNLLSVFQHDPSLARTEIAPIIFENLFLEHLLPVFQRLKDQRTRIMSCMVMNHTCESDDQDVSVVLPSNMLLSKMTEDQASELKDLEKDYEEVLNENCRIFAGYLKEVLVNKDGKRIINQPSLVLTRIRKGEKLDYRVEERIEDEEPGLQNGRYNPIWAEGEVSVEFSGNNSGSISRSISFYPQRVSLNALRNQKSSKTITTLEETKPPLDFEWSSDENSVDISWSQSEPDEIEKDNRESALFESKKIQARQQENIPPAESSLSSEALMAAESNPPGGGKQTPPKDFVCPITSHIFDDPVTLETGQTYERKAIQEWLERGNSTCPITRQSLQSTKLPKTNYVLKRLIATWKEQNPHSFSDQSENSQLDTEPDFKISMPSTSPNSVIILATMDGTVTELKIAITNLCTSEILQEAEMAVLRIERRWHEDNMKMEILSMLLKPAVVNGFVEILFNSVDPQVLRAAVFLLCELGSRDILVIQTLTQVDSDVECIVALFKKGLLEASVLIYLLKPSTTSLVDMDMVETLLAVIKMKEEESLEMSMKPKTASLLLLGQILQDVSSVVKEIVSARALESIVGSLEAEKACERIAAVGILQSCMQEDGRCRNNIADKVELAPVLECFMDANNSERFEIVHFLSELVKLNRRTFNEQVLHIIKDEGAFSTMHTLLIYLQSAIQEQIPVVAGLLLQLDLLTEPRKMSIYREEAIDSLISCLRNSNFPSSQIAAAKTILELQGRFSSSGKSLTRAYLLKRAGLDKTYKTLMRAERKKMSGELEETLEEEKAAEEWERRVAFALVSHEFGLVFEALGEGLKSKHAELSSACFLSATWLVNMLSVLPDTGIRGAARVCLLKHFISIFKTAKDTEDRALSMLALGSFIQDPEGLHDLTTYMKDILKGLRELKKSSTLAFDMLKVFSEGNDSSAEMWNHKEIVEEDCSTNGEVLSMVCFKDKIFSGHSDGTIKVWTGKGNILQLIQETREHSKAVTSLAILQSGEKLYSGSLDRTARVWSIGSELLQCLQVHDMKDQVHNLVVANSISCFIPQGAGVKAHSWNGGSKLLNPNKYVKCLALVHGKLYCGCTDNSIQEIDLASGTLTTIQNGSRKLLGKSNPVHALQVREGLIYSASTSLDGAGVKIWSTKNFSMVGSLPTTLDVRAMAISSELLYLGCKVGNVEVWNRKRQTRIETLLTGTNARVLCMALNADEEVLVAGTSDGRIKAWELS
ncbi:U-box domain [Dillenia turbinata]|uniref:RING-type E3 ubiquitin transferase n=1 Tax=Dillenia turbinata TaxID=194707 RepID=A0AAN8WAD9_9MAGN